MKTQSWVVTIDLQLTDPLTEDELDELVDELVDHKAAVSHGQDDALLGVVLDAESATYAGAAKKALTAVRAALPHKANRRAVLQKVKIQTIEDQERELLEPVIPELVGYAEIAKIAGVTRQRARQFEDIPDFPAPVVTTAAGPLRVRAAVEEWAKGRDRKPGRRAHVSAAG